MNPIIFIGPTCPHDIAAQFLSGIFEGPVRRGDVYKAVQAGATCIGIVDGYFETAAAVLHKEILFALSLGIAVYGSSSMGALRAAELADFGMQGVGEIFASYKRGETEDDDEVAVCHGPQELGFPVISEALVNIRATLRRAVGERILPPATAKALSAAAKETFYKERSYSTLLAAMAKMVPEKDVVRFEAWLKEGKIDQKRIDAVAMFADISRFKETNIRRGSCVFRFQRSKAWKDFEREALKSTRAPGH